MFTTSDLRILILLILIAAVPTFAQFSTFDIVLTNNTVLPSSAIESVASDSFSITYSNNAGGMLHTWISTDSVASLTRNYHYAIISIGVLGLTGALYGYLSTPTDSKDISFFSVSIIRFLAGGFVGSLVGGAVGLFLPRSFYDFAGKSHTAKVAILMKCRSR